MQNVLQFCFTVIPMMFSLSVFNVITDSILTKSVPSSDTGENISDSIKDFNGDINRKQQNLHDS